ncbi:MAG: hypothetical protein LBC97_14125 [Bifidobacteriaceae bacterium]|nr:hypothetical protein [Bifidobacteriaceae bacterium]
MRRDFGLPGGPAARLGAGLGLRPERGLGVRPELGLGLLPGLELRLGERHRPLSARDPIRPAAGTGNRPLHYHYHSVAPDMTMERLHDRHTV